jgi:hypothetical protein
LIRGAGADDIELARSAVTAIAERGFARGRYLSAMLGCALAEGGRAPPAS